MAESIPVTDYKDLNRIYTKRPQNRDPAQSKIRSIYALDTETHNGDIFLIADSEGNFLDKITPESCLDWLFSKRFHGTWNFFYNLSFDAEVILKLLDSTLYEFKFSKKLKFHYHGYDIEYYPTKLLRIKKGHHSVHYYDIAQFYDKKSLSVSYQENIGKLEEQYLEFKNKRSEFTLRFYNHNKKIIRNYCIQDCIYTKQLAEKWINLFHDAFSFYPAKWPSSGYLAEKVLINNGVYFPKFDSIAYKIQDLAFRSYFGGRFEMIKRGFIGKAYLYDINSAYPHAISKIPDLTKGKWIKQKSINNNAKIGFFKILADIPDDKYIPPFPFRANNNILFPSGKFETFVTLEELKVCESLKHYKILDSYQFISNSKKYPYKEFIESMYQKRHELKIANNPMQLPLKIILNSIYGKTGQKVNKIMGNLFNPVIFSFITGYTRARLYEFMRKNDLEREIVAFATDSICTSKKLDIDSAKLGDFSYEGESDDTFYLQNGFYRFQGKWKQRGLGKLGSKEIEHLETFERDGKLYYQFKVNRSTRLRSSIISNKIKDIGKIQPITREVNLNADRKRLWLDTIQSIDQKYANESMPISLNHFSKLQI